MLRPDYLLLPGDHRLLRHRIDRDHGDRLPAATLTYKFHDNMQVRLNAARTVARPQFRELMFQLYYDPETNRQYRGNPLLTDSEFANAELRYEWYFAPEQRFSIAGFYKDIDKPIEAFTGFNDNRPETSFANAPGAVLYGVELEVQKSRPRGAAGLNNSRVPETTCSSFVAAGGRSRSSPLASSKPLHRAESRLEIRIGADDHALLRLPRIPACRAS